MSKRKAKAAERDVLVNCMDLLKDTFLPVLCKNKQQFERVLAVTGYPQKRIKMNEQLQLDRYAIFASLMGQTNSQL